MLSLPTVAARTISICRKREYRDLQPGQAPGFKRALLASKAKPSGKPISTRADRVLQALKEFLATRPAGDRRRIHPVHIAYLNHETERCIATVHVSR